MCSNENNKPQEEESTNLWRLYELLWNSFHHQHWRWIDNYRIFLSLNAFLLPAVTILLGYMIKDKIYYLGIFLFFLCFIGALITSLSLLFLYRIKEDTSFKLSNLREIEKKMEFLPFKTFTKGKEHFFNNNNKKFLGIRAYPAYFMSGIAIITYYTIVGLFSIYCFDLYTFCLFLKNGLF